MIKAILFDFDGTLVDSAPAIVKTMEQTFLHLGVAVPEESAMRATIGLPLGTALQKLGALTDEQTVVATATYRELFPQFALSHLTVFPQVLDTLAILQKQGIRMGIVTSRESSSLDSIMQHHDMVSFFEAIVTGADGFKPKPAPDMAKALLGRMGLSPEEALVVGDTTYDIEMGNGCGCRTVAVTYGNHDAETLATAHPTYRIDEFAEIGEILNLEKVIAWSQQHTKAGPTHGVEHWHRVAKYGQLLCDMASSEQPNRKVVQYFAYLHDSCRWDDHGDPKHGPRAAVAIEEIRHTLLADLTEQEFQQLQRACRIHTSDSCCEDLTANICLDSDRLDLDRVGILPDPEHMASNFGAQYAKEHRQWYVERICERIPGAREHLMNE